ncbi:unnamed protein product [marine sediment metagenome]|uniref:Aldehyde ferredoxin oxidoreductase C-terminal domain-containing protein n=1 Tax=marine sediment metagenome TaxID=412755 RepID=X1BIT9_9ZZZZ
MPCGRLARVESGKWKTPVHEGSEYETISAFTAFILNKYVDAAVHASYLCNEYGIDTISMGAVIAFAMDCYESGIITRKDAGGLDLRWGNADAFIELLKKIAFKEHGIGELLGEGTRRASRVIGKGAEKLAMHGKGLEGPAHDPRSGKALAVTYGTANRGMCHIFNFYLRVELAAARGTERDVCIYPQCSFFHAAFGAVDIAYLPPESPYKLNRIL